MRPEFSVRQQADSVPPAGLDRVVEAGPEARAALAARFGLPAILSLSGRFRLTPLPGGVVRAGLALRARVRQVCVLTLEEFEAAIAEDAVLRFVPEERQRGDIDPEEAEDEIPYAGGSFDLGEAVAEQLALALDPYPRAPGASLPEAESPASPPAPEPEPPAVLARGRR
ncbi:MAG TPA: DUF177 domain-containing protein [Acetobacteraceae bacterium]|nr:DUF177 domain-containing protein [Acetobacteraceae bacterium]